MKYYSELTKKLYDSKEKLDSAEKAYEEKKSLENKKREERSLKAKEVEDAFKAARDAEKEADKKLEEFCKEYGSFHTTVREPAKYLFEDLLDFFLF